MPFIRKNVHVIHIESKSGKKGSGIKKPSSAKATAAKNHGLTVGAITSFALTPLVGIPVGYAVYRHDLSKKKK